MNRSNIIKILFVIIVISLVLGCTDNKNKTIKDINENHKLYENTTVNVKGKVVDLFLMSRGAYKIDDNTGQMWILVSNSDIPDKGVDVTVEGNVLNNITVGSQKYDIAIVEHKRSISNN